MPRETLPQPRAATPPEATGASFRQDTAALASGLERIRATVLERLERVEAAVRERAARIPATEPELAERDQDLRTRTADLERRQTEVQQRAAETDDAQRRLRSERDRWENERATLLEQLEHDRRLLAEAWERLERERLEHPENQCSPTQRDGTVERPADRAQPRVIRAVVASDDANPVEQSILRQFQAVRRDVRRNANGPAAG